MDIAFPLTREFRRLLEWLAEQARDGKRRLAFAEARNMLGIAEDAELVQMLLALKNCRELEFPPRLTSKWMPMRPGRGSPTSSGNRITYAPSVTSRPWRKSE
jgi:hypothetical protein